MQTNPAVEQSKIIRWSVSPWSQSGWKGKVYGGKDLLKSQVLSSEWNTERVREDASWRLCRLGRSVETSVMVEGEDDVERGGGCWGHMLSNSLLMDSRHSSANVGRSGGVNRLLSLRQMNACIHCWLLGLAKTHHADMEVTSTWRWRLHERQIGGLCLSSRVHAGLSKRTVSGHMTWSHVFRRWQAVGKVIPRISMTLTCSMSGRAGGV